MIVVKRKPFPKVVPCLNVWNQLLRVRLQKFGPALLTKLCCAVSFLPLAVGFSAGSSACRDPTPYLCFLSFCLHNPGHPEDGVFQLTYLLRHVLVLWSKRIIFTTLEENQWWESSNVRKKHFWSPGAWFSSSTFVRGVAGIPRFMSRAERHLSL